MLFTSYQRLNHALKEFSKTDVICNQCEKKMYPYIKPFSKNESCFYEWNFLMAICDCGTHYKHLYNFINLV